MLDVFFEPHRPVGFQPFTYLLQLRSDPYGGRLELTAESAFLIQTAVEGETEKIKRIRLAAIEDMLEKHYNPTSLVTAISGMRRFYEMFPEIQQYRLEIPARMPRKRSIIDVYSEEEQNRISDMLSSPDISRRDAAICLLSFETGLRSVDICNLRLSDVDWKHISTTSGFYAFATLDVLANALEAANPDTGTSSNILDFIAFCRLIRISQPYMWFLSVRPRVCLQLPSDSTSRWTPMLFSYVLRRCLRVLGTFTR